MKKWYYLLIFLLMLIPINAKAVYEVTDSRCTDSLKTALKEDANAVTYRLERIELNGKTLYTGYLLNITENLQLADEDNKPYSDIINNITMNSKISINIYASKNNYCNGYKLRTMMIKAPYYNIYSKNDLCIGNEEYYLCNVSSNITLSEEEFIKKMQLYIYDKKQNNNVINPIADNNEFNLIEYVKENYITLFIAVMLIILFIILEKINKSQKEKRIL